MDWAAVYKDVFGGLLIAGFLGVFVPSDFRKAFFLTDQPTLAALWGPIVGPLVSVISFVCSIGNVPLAAVLWNSGISLGGVISFIFADLIALPILNIYRKYYGTKMMLFLFATSYVAMVLAGYAIELIFATLHLIPPQRVAIVADPQVTFNYTTVLNIVFLLLAAVLVVRAARTGVGPMLRMMDAAPEPVAQRAAPATNQNGREFTCPMHPGVRMPGAGRCTKCGMPGAGRCTKCGMALQPREAASRSRG